MLKGMDVFREYFRDFSEQYVIIGGAACDIVFSEAALPFRATKDIDMVLIVEALTPEFGQRFWDFISAGGYENRAKSNDIPQFYRFDKPKESGYPYMIELFARSESLLDEDRYVCRPLHLGDEISSLSAILLNRDYYQLLMTSKEVLTDVTILPYTHLILFKAKAWLDLSSRKAAGQMVKDGDIRKHKNDVARLAALLTGNETCVVPASVFADIARFTEAFEKEPPDMRSLRISGVTANDVLVLLRTVYSVS